jgi:hypothetical protein
MQQCWLNLNLGVQSRAEKRYGILHEASSDSRKMNNSMQFWPIEVQRALNWHAGFNLMQWLGLQTCHTLTVTFTLRNYDLRTWAFITICSSYSLGIGRGRKLNIVCSWFVKNLRRELVSHQLSRWAEIGIQIPYLFELSWWKSVHTIHFEIWIFRLPKHPS